jgi:hypothetical protein
MTACSGDRGEKGHMPQKNDLYDLARFLSEKDLQLMHRLLDLLPGTWNLEVVKRIGILARGNSAKSEVLAEMARSARTGLESIDSEIRLLNVRRVELTNLMLDAVGMEQEAKEKEAPSSAA